MEGIAAAIGAYLAVRLSSLREEDVQKRLIAAGYFRLGARRFIGYRVLFTIGVAILAIWLLLLAGASGGVIVFMVIIIGAIGWVVPGFLLGSRARLRLREVDEG